MTTALEIDRATLDSLRYESALMPPLERRALHTGQALLRRTDRVLALHTPEDRFGDCVECGHAWPCPTVTILGGNQ